MGALLHRFLTGIAVAVAILAIVMAWTTESRNQALQRDMKDQQALTGALAGLAKAQADLNEQFTRNQLSLTRAMRRVLPTDSQARQLAGLAP